MYTPMRAARRLALTGWLGLAGLSLLAAPVLAAEPPEKAFPESTVFFLKINNSAGLRESFSQSQLGQLWADPALKPFKEDLSSKLDDSNKELKDKVGVSIRELLELPQGAVAFGVVPTKDDVENPVALLLTADAGKNAEKMADVLTKATKQSEEAGAKVAKEEFKGLTLYVIKAPEAKDKKEGDKPAPPAVWTHDGAQFYFGSDVDSLKDLITHAAGRDDSLAAVNNFLGSQKKLGSDGQIFWYADMGKFLGLISKAGAKSKNAANIEQFKAMSQVLGLGGLKSASGSFALNTGNYDSVSKTFVMAPAPLQGLLKILAMPKVSLKPESWVPATVATYQSFSWDLDAAFVAVNDLANMFQPGVLNVLEQQLVGPNGGEPINFKKDIFDPLGDRITVLSDFKKPITEDSQRMVLSVALEDAPGFQNTLTKLIGLAGGAPKKREFQGSTIYDFDVPEMPNANAGQVQFKGPISVTIAKNSLFVSTEPTLLEQLIRGGGPALADNADYLSVAKEIPEKVSSVSYVRPDESARLSYEMIKGGQFEKALQGAAVAGGPDVSKLGKLFDKDKLPDFSVFAKYLSQGGGYSDVSDDGVTITNFTLRKANP
jgi:hypothetical protein